MFNSQYQLNQTRATAMIDAARGDIAIAARDFIQQNNRAAAENCVRQTALLANKLFQVFENDAKRVEIAMNELYNVSVFPFIKEFAHAALIAKLDDLEQENLDPELENDFDEQGEFGIEFDHSSFKAIQYRDQLASIESNNNKDAVQVFRETIYQNYSIQVSLSDPQAYKNRKYDTETKEIENLIRLFESKFFNVRLFSQIAPLANPTPYSAGQVALFAGGINLDEIVVADDEGTELSLNLRHQHRAIRSMPPLVAIENRVEELPRRSGFRSKVSKFYRSFTSNHVHPISEGSSSGANRENNRSASGSSLKSKISKFYKSSVANLHSSSHTTSTLTPQTGESSDHSTKKAHSKSKMRHNQVHPSRT